MGVTWMKKLTTAFGERLCSESAFSIAELIVASLLLFVLTFGVYNFAGTGTSLAKSSSAKAEVNQEVRETLETMTRQIRVAYDFVTTECGSNQIGFLSYATGNDTPYHIRFQLVESDLMRSQDGVNFTVMARQVDSLAFTYYQADGTALPLDVNGNPDDTLIARVEISLTISRSYNEVMGSGSEGHRQYVERETVSASGVQSVAMRNALIDAP